MGLESQVLTNRAQLRERIEKLLEDFSAQAAPARNELRNLLAANPGAFCAAVSPLIRQLPAEAPARQFLSALLSSWEQLPRVLADPAILSTRAAQELAQALATHDPQLDTRLARWLLTGVSPEPDPEASDPVRAVRILEILEAISGGGRAVAALIQLLRHPDVRVRSKAALMAGRSLRSGHWAQQRLLEADARVRANVVEALWGVQAPGVTEVFKSALRDAHNRVVGNALVGLYRLGDPAAASLLRKMAEHPSPAFRATAAWAMGHLEDPQFLPTLATLLKDPDASVRRNVLRALARIKRATSRTVEFQETPPPAPVETPQPESAAPPVTMEN